MSAGCNIILDISHGQGSERLAHVLWTRAIVHDAGMIDSHAAPDVGLDRGGVLGDWRQR